MDNCIGSVIAVDCGADGYFQGKLTEIDLSGDSKGIFLSNVFRDGVPCGKAMRLDVALIKNLKVLKTAEPENIAPPETVQEIGLKTPKKTVKAPRNQKKISKVPQKLMTSSGKQANTWTSRPAVKIYETSAKECTSSSDIDSRSSRENVPIVTKKRARVNRTREVHAVSVQTVESTPTPLFKRYEPQVPKPQSLSAPSWALRSARKGLGPCGIPILDIQNGYGPISHKDAHLNIPTDLEELNSDFDFAVNLRMFDKNTVVTDDEDFYESVEKPKMSQNFKHDENILADPSRVTSWTKVTAKNCYSADDTVECKTPVEASKVMSFCPSSFELVSTGSRVPALDEAIKAKYLESCRSHLTSAVYSSIVADRIIMYCQDIQSSNKLRRSLNIIVLSHHSNDSIAAQVTTRLSNRGHLVSVYGDICRLNGVKHTRVKDARQLPSSPDVVICLHKETPLDVISYLELHKNAHILALECRPSVADFSKVHIMMLGVFTTGLFTAPATLAVGKTTFAALCGAVPTTKSIDCRVYDIGVPFSWIVEGGAEALSEAFSTAVYAKF